jgi:hypothetical protein
VPKSWRVHAHGTECSLIIAAYWKGDVKCGEFCMVINVITTEELPERKSSGSGLESREYGRGDPFAVAT